MKNYEETGSQERADDNLNVVRCALMLTILRKLLKIFFPQLIEMIHLDLEAGSLTSAVFVFSREQPETKVIATLSVLTVCRNAPFRVTWPPCHSVPRLKLIPVFLHVRVTVSPRLAALDIVFFKYIYNVCLYCCVGKKKHCVFQSGEFIIRLKLKCWEITAALYSLTLRKQGGNILVVCYSQQSCEPGYSVWSFGAVL